MKLMRVGEVGREKPAMLDSDGKIRDLSAHVSDIGGEAISPEGLSKLKALDPKSLPELASGRIGACVAGTGKFICIGLNFSDHAAETGATVPPEPVIAPSRRNVQASGPRASPATHSVRSDPGSSPRTRLPTRKILACG
jgi:2-keto-4-pentenoate hydratase/2-oxohepta-3-ene-1,7-dioic acid hydratase in catechol pathway